MSGWEATKSAAHAVTTSSHAALALQESFQKALRSLETGCDGWSLPRKWKRMDNQQLVYNLRVPNPERVLVIKQVNVADSCTASPRVQHRMC